MTNAEIMMVVLTAVIAVVGIIGAIIFNNQLSEMRTASGLTSRQLALMEADQRPWIALEMQLDDPLTNDASGSHLIVKYTLNNVGKSPAVAVDFMATMIPWGDRQPNPPPPPGYSVTIPTEAINTAVETICSAQDAWRSNGSGDIMFPNIPLQNRSWRISSGPNGPGFLPGFFIIGCATYKFVNDPTIHRTIRVYELGTRAYGQMIDLSEETILTTDLAFIARRQNGSRAN
jgi:hypothetical protein